MYAKESADEVCCIKEVAPQVLVPTVVLYHAVQGVLWCCYTSCYASSSVSHMFEFYQEKQLPS